ncbi:MAG: GAF domain-containing protein [Nitrospinota bacterium]|nr:GAF domain-containing protein [Nitrospinota bacterium]
MTAEDNILLIGKISRKRLDLGTMLNQVTRKAQEELNADVCALFMLDEQGQILALKSATGLNISAVNAIRLPKDRGVCWKIARERRTIALAVASQDPEFYYVPESGEDTSASMAGAPIIDEDGELLGVLYIQRRNGGGVVEVDARALERIAGEVAGAIRAARDFERQVEKARVLSELNSTARLINATNNPELILSHTGDCIRNLLGARACSIWLVEGGHMVVKSSTGPAMEAPEAVVLLAEKALKNRETTNIPDIRTQTEFPGLTSAARSSMVATPMIFENMPIGVAVMADRKTPQPNYFTTFSGEEIRFFMDLIQTTTQALVRARTHMMLEQALEENKRNMRELSILFQLSMAMQRTISLDDLLRVILSCVTVGTGLGFNRAILFLINENTGLMQGMIGMGPDSAEDAGRIWSQPESRPSEELVNWLLARKPAKESLSRFDAAARSLKLPITGPGSGAIIRAVAVEKKAMLISGRQDIIDSDRELIHALGCEHFAIVPLIVKDNVQGAILVDNLFDKKPITPRDMRLLARFSAPAAWAIENVRLMERLSSVSKELIRLETQMARVERMSTLGEVAAEMAHEIKTPLVSIGGFARRLHNNNLTREESKKYLDIIIDEVERLEKMLRNALDISKGVSMHIVSADLNGIVEEAINFYWRIINENGVETVLSLSRDIENVSIDPVWIRQVVINIILNAIEAMSGLEGKRTLTVVTQNAPRRPGWVRLSISDTGGGIHNMNLDDVFEPFFTTKTHGTGIGLTLAKKIVRMHHGDLEIDNKPGVGVTFVIDLPCQMIPGSPESTSAIGAGR